MLRVEWVKSRARVLRWSEEVLLLKEEMRRVLVYLEYKAKWWEERAVPWDGLDSETTEGVRAYALRQASIQRALSEHFARMWAAPLEATVSGEESAEDMLRPSGSAGPSQDGDEVLSDGLDVEDDDAAEDADD